MPQKENSRCWMCGRTSIEVRESVGKPQLPESEVDRRFARVRDMRATFTRDSGEWWTRVPDQLKTMDFNFVMGNVSQFKGVGFVEEAARIKTSIADPMSEAARQARAGQVVALGDVKIPTNDAGKRASVVRAVDDFERKSGRTLSDGTAPNGSPHGFEGLDFGRGVIYLRDIGMLYYAVQEKLLESEREDEMSKRPTFGVGVAHLPTVAGELHICSICQNLITALPSA